MPRLTRQTPSYRLHKASGQAIVRLDGRDHYLGPYDTTESRAEYDRLIGVWMANGRRMPSSDSSHDLSINELLVAFMGHAERHYRHADGTPTREVANFRDSIRPLKFLHGSTAAGSFTPKSLKDVRNAMIRDGLSRGVINQRIGRIVHIFKWAVSEELVPPGVHHGLKSVSGLQRGRTEARESEPVRPVPDDRVDAIRPHVSRQVWAMIELQRLTGMRPGEVCLMRGIDLDMSGRVWTFVPERHKTECHGKERTIYLGPRAQETLRPWLRTELTAYLFSPSEAREERFARMRAGRKSKVQPSQRNRGKPKAKRPGLRYTAQTYYGAIRRGCERAWPHPSLSKLAKKALSEAERGELREWNGRHSWHPNQLRHNAATLLRKEFGLDVARVLLGHSTPATTEIYAELDRAKALEIVEKIG